MLVLFVVPSCWFMVGTAIEFSRYCWPCWLQYVVLHTWFRHSERESNACIVMQLWCWQWDTMWYPNVKMEIVFIWNTVKIHVKIVKMSTRISGCHVRQKASRWSLRLSIDLPVVGVLRELLGEVCIVHAAEIMVPSVCLKLDRKIPWSITPSSPLEWPFWIILGYPMVSSIFG